MLILSLLLKPKTAVGNTGSRGYSNSVGYNYSGEVTRDVCIRFSIRLDGSVTAARASATTTVVRLNLTFRRGLDPVLCHAQHGVCLRPPPKV